MQFHANYVSTLIEGDYYSAMFADEDSDDPDIYLIIQRQFEDLEDDTCYIETHDREYTGHFFVRRLEFTPETLLVEFDRPSNNLITVTLRMPRSKFAKASRVMKVIGGEIEPQISWSMRSKVLRSGGAD